jgi:hypothetical protein
MTQAVVGVFHNPANARHAVEDLLKGGFSQQRISTISPESPQATHISMPGSRAEHIEDLAIGAFGGSMFGAILGALIGPLVMSAPSLGQLLLNSGLAATTGAEVAMMVVGAVFGLILGGILGANSWSGISNAEAHAYEELVQHGDTLVVVEADGAQRDQAFAIMHDDGAAEANELKASFHHAGLL